MTDSEIHLCSGVTDRPCSWAANFNKIIQEWHVEEDLHAVNAKYMVHVCSVAQSCLTLCDFRDCSPPTFFAHGIFQTRILEWVAVSYARASSQPKDQTTYLMSPALADRFFTTVSPEKPKCMVAVYYCCYFSWESSTWSPSGKVLFFQHPNGV